jgi:hypothetical protein
VDEGKLEVLGKGPATGYSLAGAAVVRAHLKTPYNRRRRVSYKKEFLDRYIPNKTFYLSEADRHGLREAGTPTAAPLPAGTYACRILERLLIELSWASSRMREDFGTVNILPTAIGSPGSSCPSVSGAGPKFPRCTVADMIEGQYLLVTDHLKIISLVGDPRGLKGNTARLLSHVLEGAEAEGATDETIVLAGTNVLPCLACDSCHSVQCTGKEPDAILEGKGRRSWGGGGPKVV